MYAASPRLATMLSLVLVCCAGRTAVAADVVTTEGRITDAGSGAPISGAHVSLHDEGGGVLEARSDRAGRYHLLSTTPGAVDVAVERAGFDPVSQRCFVGPGDALRVDISLYRTLREITSIRSRRTFRCEIEPDTVDHYVIR